MLAYMKIIVTLFWRSLKITIICAKIQAEIFFPLLWKSPFKSFFSLLISKENQFTHVFSYIFACDFCIVSLCEVMHAYFAVRLWHRLHKLKWDDPRWLWHRSYQDFRVRGTNHKYMSVVTEVAVPLFNIFQSPPVSKPGGARLRFWVYSAHLNILTKKDIAR